LHQLAKATLTELGPQFFCSINIMYSRKRVLFVTWDGPQTNYLENLFFPIFSQLKEWDFHVLQFSWAKQDKPQELMHLARTLGIHYTHIPSQRWPHPLVGTVFTLRKGIQKLKAYIDRHRIEDRKSTRLNSSHVKISYAVFCL